MRDGLRQDDLFTCSLMSLVGIGIEHLRDRFPFEDQTIVAYGGLFASATRTAIGLEQIVGDCFRLTTVVEQFVGQWLQLAIENQSGMPTRGNTFGQNLQLGEDAVVGTCVWDVQSRFRVVLGPLTRNELVTLLPGEKQLQAIVNLIRLYVGINRDFDIQLILKKEEVPACRLGASENYEPRLGWTTWLPTAEQRDTDSRDVTFRF
jgi:type VI secretion system protein ImpH